MRVCELIDSTTKQWDWEKIFDLFDHRTRVEILAVPLLDRYRRDELVWKENKNQVFSFKSAYQVALRLKDCVHAEHSAARLDRATWKKIWALNVPPKVRTFVWRACFDILPTRDNLHRRRVRVDPRCELCCQQTESAGHLQWECPLARNVWALCRGRIQKCSNSAQDVFTLFHQMVGCLSQQDLKKWAVISWGIWNARNKFYFEKIQLHPKVIFMVLLVIWTSINVWLLINRMTDFFASG